MPQSLDGNPLETTTPAIVPFAHPQADAWRRELEARYTEMAQLAGGLAHEIRNPLSTMRLILDLLVEEFQESEEARDRRVLKKLERVRQESNRLQNILEDFLRLTRVQELEAAPVDLNALVEDLRDFFEPQAAQHGVVIRMAFAPGLPCARLDADLLKQALLNLMLNAQQAMPDGGELMLKTRRDDPWDVLEVIDTGGGITPESKDRIFEPFYSTKPGGNGLGLPTVRRIIEAHGGTVVVESEPGRGTRFILRLPQATGG